MLPATDPKKVYDLTKVRRFVRELLGFLSHILTRISHRWSTATPQSSALAVLCSVGLLDVLYKYDCGGSPRVVSVASLARTALAAPRYDKR